MKKNITWAILVLIHLLFLAWAFHSGNAELKDSSEYIQQAKNLRSDLTWYCGDLTQRIDPALYSQRPPLYGAFLAVTWWPIPADVPVLVFQILLSLFNCLLAYRIVSLILKKDVNPILFFLPILFYATQFVFANMIMSEILFQTMWLLAAYFGIQFLLDFKNSDLILHQLAVTASFLVKPVAFVFPFFSAIGIIILIMKRRVLSSAFSSLLIPVSVLLIIFFMNYKHTKVIEYSSIQRKLMINYNIPALLSTKMPVEAAMKEVDSIQNIASRLEYPLRAQYIDQQCLKWIKADPITYLNLHFKGAIRFFLDHGRWDLNAFFNTKNSSSAKIMVYYLVLAILMNLILLIAFLRFLFLKNIPVPIRAFLASMLLYIALLSGPTGGARLRIPVYPLLLVTCSLSLNFYLDRRKEHA